MLEFYNQFLNIFTDQTFFFFCAYIGTFTLLIQFILNIFGLIDSEEFSDHDVGVEKTFKFLSLQTIAGFLMMFGWSAIAFNKELNLNLAVSIILSFIIGLISIFIINFIFRVAKKLQSHGSRCEIDQVIGKEAVVYQRIPKDGVGKVSISFQHLTCEIDAISDSYTEIPSFTRVLIIKKFDELTVIVKSI